MKVFYIYLQNLKHDDTGYLLSLSNCKYGLQFTT